MEWLIVALPPCVIGIVGFVLSNRIQKRNRDKAMAQVVADRLMGIKAVSSPLTTFPSHKGRRKSGHKGRRKGHRK